MLIGISDICRIAIGFPGATWRTVKNFFGNTLRTWWYSHY